MAAVQSRPVGVEEGGNVVTVRSVAPGEVEEFLDWFERYWEELESFSDFPDPFSRAEYRRLLAQREGQQFWWADVDGEHIGFCVFTIRLHWYRREVTAGYIDEFYVVPAARRHGLGGAVVRAMLAEFRRHGVRQVELSVLPRNTRARAFWARMGFAVDKLLMQQRLTGEDMVDTTQD